MASTRRKCFVFFVRTASSSRNGEQKETTPQRYRNLFIGPQCEISEDSFLQYNMQMESISYGNSANNGTMIHIEFFGDHFIAILFTAQYSTTHSICLLFVCIGHVFLQGCLPSIRACKREGSAASEQETRSGSGTPLQLPALRPKYQHSISLNIGILLIRDILSLCTSKYSGSRAPALAPF